MFLCWQTRQILLYFFSITMKKLSRACVNLFYILYVQRGLQNAVGTVSCPSFSWQELTRKVCDCGFTCVLVAWWSHLSLTVGLHKLAEGCVSLDFKLDHWPVLSRHLQVDVVVVLCLYTLLRKQKHTYEILHHSSWHNIYNYSMYFLFKKYIRHIGQPLHNIHRRLYTMAHL